MGVSVVSQSLFEAARRRIARIAPRRQEILAGLIAPSLLGVALLAGEAILRFEQWRVFGANQAFETKVQEEIWELKDDRRRPRPGAEMGHTRFNAQGFRGETVPIPKRDGVVRIGFFGSSTTAEVHIGNISQTWLVVAMARFGSAYPNCRLDFFNAGVPGYSVGDVHRRIAEESAPLQADIAVITINDVTSRGRKQLVARGVEANAYRPSWLAERSLLWLKLEKNAEAQRLKRLALRRDLANRLDFAALKRDLRADLISLVQMVSTQSALPVLVENASIMRREQSLETQAEYAINRLLYLPGLFIGDMTESLYRYNETLGSVAKQSGIPLIRTLDAMPAKRSFYRDATHTTASGNQRLGEIVGAALSADPAVRQVLNRRGAGCAG